MASKKPAPLQNTARLTRDEWLKTALEVLSQEGESKLRIDAISAALGVTKGSFYWHFRGRKDFLQAIVEFWAKEYNARVPITVEAHGGTPHEKLRCLLELVTSENLGKYDFAFDAWATHEPSIGDQVKQVYALRLEYVGSLFREMGFRGVDLDTRVTAFLSFVKVESQVIGKTRPKRSPRRLKQELEFFVRPLQ